MSEDSVFTKIIKGEIPSHKLYEDDKVLAFLDIHPVQPGHTLVISKAAIDHPWDLPDEDYTALMAATKKVARKLREVLKTERVCEQIVGFDIPHAHVHLIPCNSTKDFRRIPDTSVEPDHDDLAKMAEKLRIA